MRVEHEETTIIEVIDQIILNARENCKPIKYIELDPDEFNEFIDKCKTERYLGILESYYRSRDNIESSWAVYRGVDIITNVS